MLRLAALALVLSTPALASPRDQALALYRETIRAEANFSNAYPAAAPAMTAARDALDYHKSQNPDALPDCMSAASTLLMAVGLMQAGNLAAAETSARDFYTWRRNCERALKLKPAARPLETTLRLYRKP